MSRTTQVGLEKLFLPMFCLAREDRRKGNGTERGGGRRGAGKNKVQRDQESTKHRASSKFDVNEIGGNWVKPSI